MWRRNQPGDPRTPITGEALQDVGISAYLDHNWNSRWSSASDGRA
jgi:hypothetical protein